MAAGEAVMAIALADSLFLSISPGAARNKVLLFLVVSMAPFAIVSPLIGPAVDRMKGGRRLMICFASAGRAIVTALMIRNVDSLTLFPLAFAALVLSKSYAVSKSALVPMVVRDDKEFVEANSKLGLIAGLSGFLVALPAGILQFISAEITLFFSTLVFVAAFFAALKLPKGGVVADRPPAPAERQSLRSQNVVGAANAMGLLRSSAGFLFFHLAFWLRGETAGVFWFGVAVAASSLGTMAANALGPMVRRRAQEETMLILAAVLLVGSGLVAALGGGTLWAIVLAASVNFASSTGRLAFEAVIQRDAPEANRARIFAQFETRFQLQWVLAGLIPVIIPIGGKLGFLIIAAMGFVAVLQLKSRHPDWPRTRFRR